MEYQSHTFNTKISEEFLNESAPYTLQRLLGKLYLSSHRQRRHKCHKEASNSSPNRVRGLFPQEEDHNVHA